MRSHLIEGVECEVLGEVGWKFTDIRQLPGVMMTSDGHGMAHDIVEHCNGLHKIGSIHDELEALGALWFVRCETGVIYEPELALKNDLVNVLEDALMAYAPYDYIRHSSRHSAPESFTDDVLQETRQALIDTLGYHDLEPDDPILERFTQDAQRLMTVGYRKAKKRWRLNWEALEQFQAIERGFRHYEGCAEEGDQLMLTWGAGRASVREVYDQ